METKELHEAFNTLFENNDRVSVILNKTAEGKRSQIAIYNEDLLNYNEPFRNKSTFKENEVVVSLIQLEDKGIVFLIDKIVKINSFKGNEDPSKNEFNYDILNEYSYLFGKTTIICNGNIKAQNKKRVNGAKEFLMNTEVAHEYEGAQFDGNYTSIRNAAWKTLHSWITNTTLNKSMRDALKRVKGVYMIHDRLSGKDYIGSASGEGGILQRWTNYVTGDCTGGNEGLKELAPEYIQENFEYNVIDWFPLSCDTQFIIDAETNRKEMFETRMRVGSGYNKN